MTIMKSTVTLSSMGTDMTKRRMGLRQGIVTVREKKGGVLYQGLPKPAHTGSIQLLSITSEITYLHDSFHS